MRSEIWCSLSDFQAATKRQDISLVALLLPPQSSSSELTLFCKERTDLELQAVRETEYYAALQQYYRPVRLLAWLVVLLVSGAGLFAGMNMMYGAIAGRIREIATLQAVGYRRKAILLSLIQEGVVMAAAASLLAGVFALTVLNGHAIRFTMGAFGITNRQFRSGCRMRSWVVTWSFGRAATSGQGITTVGGCLFESNLGVIYENSQHSDFWIHACTSRMRRGDE